MNFTVWHSSESMADFIIDHTILRNYNCIKKKIAESDASKPSEFHKVPEHLKKILYLDAPDIIVELNGEPIFSFEDSKEAGTGHNSFQRFSRLAAAAENAIPAFYLYPEAVVIGRAASPYKWDVINPLIFRALSRLMDIYTTPAFLFFYPSFYREMQGENSERLQLLPNKGLKLNSDNLRYSACPFVDDEVQQMLSLMDELLTLVIERGVREGISSCLTRRRFSMRRDWHQDQYHQRNPQNKMLSPISQTKLVPSSSILDYIHSKTGIPIHASILNSRETTVLYSVNANFRGDPYPGALAALDYMLCRNGKTFEDREYNLVMAWGEVQFDSETNEITIIGDDQKSINVFCGKVQNSEGKNLLGRNYSEIENRDIPRYYMQVRYGSMYSKSKEIRIYAYFCDAILFHDGVLWREG